MITYQVEDWCYFLNEAKSLWPTHYEEVDTLKEKLEVDPDLETYEILNSLGKLHIVTVRKDGELVGYHLSIVDRLSHHRKILAAVGDLYWIRKDCRGARVGIKMFKKAEETLRTRGVKVFHNIANLNNPHSRLFEYLGHVPTVIRYQKVIGV